MTFQVGIIGPVGAKGLCRTIIPWPMEAHVAVAGDKGDQGVQGPTGPQGIEGEQVRED
jgi:hypothetical protein